MEVRNDNVESWAEMPIVMKDRKSCIGYYRPVPATNKFVSRLQKFFKDRQLNV